MLQTRDSRRSLGSGRTSDGARQHPGAKLFSGDQRRGWVKVGGGSNKHAATHSEGAWLFRKGCSGDPWHSAGARACATQPDAHRHWKGGARCLPRRFSAPEPEQPGSQLPGRKADVRQSGGVLGGGAGLPFFGLEVGGRGRAREGSRAGRGRQGGRGPHSTLQQLMQPFWEP